MVNGWMVVQRAHDCHCHSQQAQCWVWRPAKLSSTLLGKLILVLPGTSGMALLCQRAYTSRAGAAACSVLAAAALQPVAVY
jgi:hypothetical protein